MVEITVSRWCGWCFFRVLCAAPLMQVKAFFISFNLMWFFLLCRALVHVFTLCTVKWFVAQMTIGYFRWSHKITLIIVIHFDSDNWNGLRFIRIRFCHFHIDEWMQHRTMGCCAVFIYLSCRRSHSLYIHSQLRLIHSLVCGLFSTLFKPYFLKFTWNWNPFEIILYFILFFSQ